MLTVSNCIFLKIKLLNINFCHRTLKRNSVNNRQCCQEYFITGIELLVFAKVVYKKGFVVSNQILIELCPNTQLVTGNLRVACDLILYEEGLNFIPVQLKSVLVKTDLNFKFREVKTLISAKITFTSLNHRFKLL